VWPNESCMSDHIAEFVRASTFLLLLSVFILLLSALPPLLSMGSSQSPQNISGKVQIDSPNVKDLVKSMNNVATEMLIGISQANSSLNNISSNIDQVLQLNQTTQKLESKLKNLKDELQIPNERIKK
jgi:predicted PurR-regulated permease PerM